MSTIFRTKLLYYLIQTTVLRVSNEPLESPHEPLTGPWVSKAGRPHLYNGRAHGDVIEHIFDRLDAPQAYNRYPDGSSALPRQAEGRSEEHTSELQSRS